MAQPDISTLGFARAFGVQPAAEIDQLRAMLADRNATIALQADIIRSLTAKVEALEVLVTKLVEERSRNSTNSNLPP